ARRRCRPRTGRRPRTRRSRRRTRLRSAPATPTRACAETCGTRRAGSRARRRRPRTSSPGPGGGERLRADREAVASRDPRSSRPGGPVFGYGARMDDVSLHQLVELLPPRIWYLTSNGTDMWCRRPYGFLFSTGESAEKFAQAMGTGEALFAVGLDAGALISD